MKNGKQWPDNIQAIMQKIRAHSPANGEAIKQTGEKRRGNHQSRELSKTEKDKVEAKRQETKGWGKDGSSTKANNRISWKKGQWERKVATRSNWFGLAVGSPLRVSRWGIWKRYQTSVAVINQNSKEAVQRRTLHGYERRQTATKGTETNKLGGMHKTVYTG